MECVKKLDGGNMGYTVEYRPDRHLISVRHEGNLDSREVEGYSTEALALAYSVEPRRNLGSME